MIVLRSIDTDETAALLIDLCNKAGRPPPGVPLALAPPIVSLGKRKRDAEVVTVWKRQLMCIPSVSERIATSLLERFKMVSLKDGPKEFPRVRLDERSCLGQKRIELLVKYFCADGAS